MKLSHWVPKQRLLVDEHSNCSAFVVGARGTKSIEMLPGGIVIIEREGSETLVTTEPGSGLVLVEEAAKPEPKPEPRPKAKSQPKGAVA